MSDTASAAPHTSAADVAAATDASNANARRDYLRAQSDHELMVMIADNLITMREGIEGAIEGLSQVPFLRGRF